MLDKITRDYVASQNDSLNKKEVTTKLSLDSFDAPAYEEAFKNYFLPYVLNLAINNTLRGTVIKIALNKEDKTFVLRDNSLGEDGVLSYEKSKISGFFNKDIDVEINYFAMSENESEHGVELIVRFID